MAAALRPGLKTPAPPRAVDEWVPLGIRTDGAKLIADYEAQGAEVYMIQVPADDFGYVINEAQKGQIMPFSPTLLGVPIQPWAQGHMAIMARKQEVPQPLLVDASGRELDVTKEGG